MSFAIAVEITMRFEGIDFDHPGDPGGKTRFGISQRAYPQIDLATLTADRARQIYERDYWVKSYANELPQWMGICHFDAAVNHGRSRAAKILQHAIGVKVDGAIGPQTLAAAHRFADKPEALDLLLAQRACGYAHLYGDRMVDLATGRKSNRPHAEHFILGWYKRVIMLAAEVRQYV